MPVTLKTFDIIKALHRVEKDQDKINSFTDILTTEAAKVDFGRKIIDRIRERTSEGIDKNNQSFAPYSKAYKESFIFKLFKGGRVNLKLTGQMLSSMDVMGTTKTGVQIGFASPTQEQKAKGHILGTGYKNNLPVRDFFGLPDDDLNSIIKTIVRDANQAVASRQFIEATVAAAQTNEAVNITDSDVVSFIAGEGIRGNL